MKSQIDPTRCFGDNCARHDVLLWGLGLLYATDKWTAEREADLDH